MTARTVFPFLLALLLALPATLDAQVDVKVKSRVKVVETRARAVRVGGDTVSRVDTTFAFDPRGTIDLSLVGGSVRVRGWDRDQVQLRAEADGGGLALDASRMHVTLGWRPTGRSRGRRAATYELSVPNGVRLAIEGANVGTIDVRGVRGGLQVENANGDVTLADVGGLVEVELMNGDVDVTNIDGELRVEQASGDVRIAGAAGRIEVETVSGDVRVSGGRARELRLESTSGTLAYDGDVRADGRYELTSHSGDVYLRLPEAVRARLIAETYHGEFRSDFPVVMQPGAFRGRDRRQYELVIGDGTGPVVRVESFSGDIHLGRAGARPAPATSPSSRSAP